MKRSKKLTLTRVRLIILALFILFISYDAYMHQQNGGSPDGTPSIHALCPYGGLESLYNLFTEGALIDKIYAGTFALFIISIITAIIFRRAFCGWICPFGGIQEFLGRLGKKVMGKQLIMPVKADSLLRYLKYPVLILTIVLAWITASLWMSPYDPWAAFGHLSEGIPAVWAEFAIGFIILIISLIGSFFYDRFFCKYLCPMGGFLGIVARISPFRIKRDAEVCIDCNICNKVCPVNIDVAHAITVSSAECINCQECTNACPKDGALTNGFAFWKNKSIKPMFVGLMVLLIYFGGIGIARLSGLYQTLPKEINAQTVITDVEELKGYMTISEVSITTGIPLEEVYLKMGIPVNVPEETTMKDIGQFVPGFEFHDAREGLKD